jgi:hypothetical protein
MTNEAIDSLLPRVRRSNALKWWATLTQVEREQYCAAHHDHERHCNTLTGKEIQSIYEITIS